jgi:hypothetical protein
MSIRDSLRAMFANALLVRNSTCSRGISSRQCPAGKKLYIQQRYIQSINHHLAVHHTPADGTQVKQDDEAETAIQVGRTVTHAPCYMRTQLWLGVLQRHPGLGNKAARQFNSLLREVCSSFSAHSLTSLL